MILVYSVTETNKRTHESKTIHRKTFVYHEWPKNLTQVTESAWQVDAVKKGHIFVDCQGEKIEAMEEVKWKNIQRNNSVPSPEKFKNTKNKK